MAKLSDPLERMANNYKKLMSLGIKTEDDIPSKANKIKNRVKELEDV